MALRSSRSSAWGLTENPVAPNCPRPAAQSARGKPSALAHAQHHGAKVRSIVDGPLQRAATHSSGFDAVADIGQPLATQSSGRQVGRCFAQLAYGRHTARGNVRGDDHVAQFSNRMLNGIGSGAKTSNAAADTWPLCSASVRAAESTRSPRATLIRIRPGRTMASDSRLIRPRVSLVEGQCSVITSDCESSSRSAYTLAASVLDVAGIDDGVMHQDLAFERPQPRDDFTTDSAEARQHRR